MSQGEIERSNFLLLHTIATRTLSLSPLQVVWPKKWLHCIVFQFFYYNLQKSIRCSYILFWYLFPFYIHVHYYVNRYKYIKKRFKPSLHFLYIILCHGWYKNDSYLPYTFIKAHICAWVLFISLRHGYFKWCSC